jgi:AraC-like DNA-binding protein
MESVIERPRAQVTRPNGAVVARTITDEAESYSSSVSGIDIESFRAGNGARPTSVLTAADDRLTFTGCKIGFPMLSSANLAADMTIVACVRSAPPGSRWCEIDLEPGQVVLYGPEAVHTARNQPGLDFMFAVTRLSHVHEHAEQIGRRITPPKPGRVRLLANPTEHQEVHQTYQTFAAVAANGGHLSTVDSDNMLRAMTHAMSADAEVANTIGDNSGIDSRRVVRTCVDYAESIGRIPSISELCLATHVSERRLRTAFTAEFDMPPSRFFRAWALEAAHRRLLQCDEKDHTVTSVATSLGFEHLGRFSGRYRETYRELPSATLRH